MDYSDLSSKETADLVFADKTNYITDHEGTFERDCSGRTKMRNSLPLDFSELPCKNKIESFLYKESKFPYG